MELRPAEAPVCVKMDATRASQALLNLCVNAQDAMPQGGRIILANTIVRLTPEQASQPGVSAGTPFARCSVNDNGGGIEPELLPRIFQSFFTTKATGKGTGLGLSIVQRIVREAGGFVEVESVVGCGTTFHLYLPLVQEKQAPSDAAPNAPLVRGSGRVLVVDDIDLLRDFAKNFLELAGLQVVVADSGSEALRLLAQSDPPVDLVFTDYCMPGMNGVELIEKILVRWPETKFVLASGFLDDDIRAQAARYCSAILSKPYDMREACKIIVDQIARKKRKANPLEKPV
jgi:CheY-like chemotaxis protein